MVKWLIAVMLSLVATAVSGQCLKADIIFILDWSGSEDSNQVYIPSAALAFMNDLNLGLSSVKMGVIPFNEAPVVSHCLRPSFDKALIQDALVSLMGMEPNGGTTFTESFILADSYFDISEKERGEPVMRIVIFISDGDENHIFDRELSVIASDILKNHGASIWCIATPTSNGTRPASEQFHLRRIGSKPSEIFYIEENYYGLKEELSRLDVCP